MSIIWSTPQPIFDKLNAEFCFDMDVCADPENAKCRMFYTRGKGLDADWGGVCFLNPPYGREISKWMRRAFHAANTGQATVVCLIPNRSNAPWWHDYVMKATEIRFVRKKVAFAGGTGVPFWGSVIAVFRKGQVCKSPKVSSWEQPQRSKTGVTE